MRYVQIRWLTPGAIHLYGKFTSCTLISEDFNHYVVHVRLRYVSSCAALGNVKTHAHVRLQTTEQVSGRRIRFMKMWLGGNSCTSLRTSPNSFFLKKKQLVWWIYSLVSEVEKWIWKKKIGYVGRWLRTYIIKPLYFILKFIPSGAPGYL